MEPGETKARAEVTFEEQAPVAAPEKKMSEEELAMWRTKASKLKIRLRAILRTTKLPKL